MNPTTTIFTRTATAVTLLAALLVSAALTAAPIAGAATDSATFASGLNWPTAFTFAPDGRVFYVERFSGQIRILSADGNDDDLFFTVPNSAGDIGNEDGMLGIALHPDYPATPQVFAYATRNVGGTVRNQIVRITDNAGTGEAMSVIFSSSTQVGEYHDGGRILFGPDDMLYAIVGDAHSPGNAQRLGNPAGKILRMKPDGDAPNDNPFGDKVIWAYGIRNSYGFAFDPQNGRLWESENGPECNDEVNLIKRRRNHGWGPHETCGHPPKTPRNTNRDGNKVVMPKAWYVNTIAPTGMAFCDGCQVSGAHGRLLMGDFNRGDIRKFRLNAKRNAIRSQSVIYTHNDGILSMETAPDGRVYFSDPNGIYRLRDAP